MQRQSFIPSPKYLLIFKKHTVEPSALVLREMPTRWGSCTPKRKLILNAESIKAPRGCIEYVIIYELCHLIHHNHTQNFLICKPAYVTNLKFAPAEISILYRGRGDAENRIKELKYDFGFDSFNLKDFYATEAALTFAIIAYNLMALFRTFVLQAKT